MSEGELSETDENYNLIIGRHCLSRVPHYLLGAAKEAVSYGANGLMVYLGAPQNSNRPSLSALKVPEFKKILAKNNIDLRNVIVHGPYILNLANTIDEKEEEKFNWSVRFLKKEL